MCALTLYIDILQHLLQQLCCVVNAVIAAAKNFSCADAFKLAAVCTSALVLESAVKLSCTRTLNKSEYHFCTAQSAAGSVTSSHTTAKGRTESFQCCFVSIDTVSKCEENRLTAIIAAVFDRNCLFCFSECALCLCALFLYHYLYFFINNIQKSY